MRVFEILDGRGRDKAPCGVLRYDEASGEFDIAIAPHVTEPNVPALFVPFLEKGQRHIPANWARRWVEERIVPPSRQNLGEILRANGMEDYDELEMLLVGDGRCSQDDFYVREVPDELYSVALAEGEWPESPAAGNWKLDAARAGSVIRSARKQANLTQRELSQRTGIQQADISRIESGKANPTLETLSAIASALGGRLDVSVAQSK